VFGHEKSPSTTVLDAVGNHRRLSADGTMKQEGRKRNFAPGDTFGLQNGKNREHIRCYEGRALEGAHDRESKQGGLEGLASSRTCSYPKTQRRGCNRNVAISQQYVLVVADTDCSDQMMTRIR